MLVQKISLLCSVLLFVQIQACSEAPQPILSQRKSIIPEDDDQNPSTGEGDSEKPGRDEEDDGDTSENGEENEGNGNGNGNGNENGNGGGSTDGGTGGGDKGKTPGGDTGTKDPTPPIKDDPKGEPLPPGSKTPTAFGNPLYPAGRGAQVSWQEYQAENGKTNATVIGPNRTRYDANFIEAEAIGRKAVRLTKTGDYVSIVSAKAANSLVVRLSIPDSANGGGIDSTLSLYINDKKVKTLAVTSRYSWVYGGEQVNTPNNPSAGQPHAFFDEVRTLVDEFPAGTEIKLQKDAGDSAAFYVVDLIDLEKVAAPLTQPAGSYSLADTGAKPNDAIDDAKNLQKAIESAMASPSKTLWIPAGTWQINEFVTQNPGISLTGVKVIGAGMWHSTLKGKNTSFYCYGDGGCTFEDFAIVGETDRRDDNVPDNAFNGSMGRGTKITRVWVEHVKVGCWCGSDGPQIPTTDMVVSESRFRNVYADGVNFVNGASGSSIVNTHFRNTGDDAVAIWSHQKSGKPATSKNTIKNVTVQMPWRANCFAVYGGDSHVIQDSICEDVLTYPGLFVANLFEPHPFTGMGYARNLTIIRGGGPMYNQEMGAIKLLSENGPVANFTFENISLIDSTFSGIHFAGNGGFNNVNFKNITIDGAGTHGILSTSSQGRVSMEGVVVKNQKGKGLEKGGAPDSFFDKKAGNSGW